MIIFLNPLIDDCSRPRAAHIGAKDCTLVLEQPWFRHYAARFREEYRDREILHLRIQCRIARSIITIVSTPFVRVKAEEFNVVSCVSASQIVLKIRA